MNTMLFEKYSKDSKVNILIVTENKEDIALTHKEIKGLNREFVLCEPDNKNDFATQLNKFKPDIILTEIFSKGTSTEKVLDLSINRRFPIPVIIFTPVKNEAEALEFVKKGAWDYVIRESPERLGQTIIRALEWKHLRKKLQFAEQDVNEYEKYINQYRLWESNVPAIAYLYVLHPNGTQAFRYVSSASKRLLNLDPKDIVSDSSILMNQIHPEDMPGLQEAIIESAVNLKPFKYQVRLLRNGIINWFDINSHPYKEPGGDIVWDGIMVDITEKKLVEEGLSKEHNLLHILMDNSPDVIYFKDLESRFIKVNKGYLNKFNISSESDLLGKTDFDLFGFEHANDARNDELEIIRTGKPIIDKIEKETWVSGKVTWVSTSKMPLKDSNGNVVGTFGVSRDITERKIAEEKLKLSEERLRYIISSNAVIQFSLDLLNNQTRPAWISDNIKDTLGYTSEEVLSPEWWSQGLHPDDQGYVNTIFPSIFEKNNLVYEFRFKHKTGHYVWLRTELVLIRDSSGKPKEIFGSWLDITELMIAQEALYASEAQLSYALKIAKLAHWEYDVLADSFTLNDQFFSMLNTTVENEGGYSISSRDLAERFVHPDNRHIVGNEIEKAINTTDPNFSSQLEIHIVYADDRAGYFSVRFFIKKDARDRTIKIFGVVQDITDRILREQEKQELEIQLKQRNKELEEMLTDLKQMQGTLVQSEKMASLGQLSAGIAHEINNPLAFVSSNINRLNEYFRDVVEVLRKWQGVKVTLPKIPDFNMKLEEIDVFSERVELDFILEDFDRMMISIQDGNQRIKKIVEGMRGFAHLSDSSFAGANINQAIEDTLTIVWNEIKYKATIEKNYGDLPPVTCNIVEIKQVLVNLLVNAAQAIEEKGIIKVSTDVNDGYVYIKIEDSGSGIPEEKIKRIFDPFFTTKAVGKGTGLGLWISSSIVEKHSGTITVESKVDIGSTFTVKLPVVQQTANSKSEVMTI